VIKTNQARTLAEWVKYLYNEDPYKLPSDELKQVVGFRSELAAWGIKVDAGDITVYKTRSTVVVSIHTITVAGRQIYNIHDWPEKSTPAESDSFYCVECEVHMGSNVDLMCNACVQNRAKSFKEKPFKEW